MRRETALAVYFERRNTSPFLFNLDNRFLQCFDVSEQRAASRCFLSVVVSRHGRLWKLPQGAGGLKARFGEPFPAGGQRSYSDTRRDTSERRTICQSVWVRPPSLNSQWLESAGVMCQYGVRPSSRRVSNLQQGRFVVRYFSVMTGTAIFESHLRNTRVGASSDMFIVKKNTNKNNKSHI